MELIVHFVLGMSAGILAFQPFVSRIKSSTLAVMSGFWAVGPDISKFVDVATGLHDSAWSNVFWFHGMLDSIETGSPNIEAFVALAVLLVAVLIGERRKT